MVRSYTSQLWAVFCIHVPISETNWPKKKSRKLRCLSAANVCRHGNAPVTTRRGCPVTSSGTVATLEAELSGSCAMMHYRNRGGPPNGLVPLGADAAEEEGILIAVMTESPSFSPSVISV